MKRKSHINTDIKLSKKQRFEEENFSYEQISSLFHLPINIACLSLNTEVDTLIQKCREFGIKR